MGFDANCRDSLLSIAETLGLDTDAEDIYIQTEVAVERLKRPAYKHDNYLETGNEIQAFLHCRECLRTKPPDQSPLEWARISVGLTPQGIQIWCARHDINIDHITIGYPDDTTKPLKLSCQCHEGEPA